MKPLVLDFLHRWWWLFTLTLLMAVFTSLAGVPFIFAPATVVALLLDAQRGVFRAVRPLPIPRAEQAKAWWIVGVPLLPLLSLPALALGVLIFQEFDPPKNARLFQPVAPPQTPAPLRAEVQPAPSPGVQEAAPRFTAASPQEGKKTAAWFAAGAQAWVALGYAAFCFFLMQWAPTRPAEKLAENVQQGIFGALWGLSVPGVAFLLPNLPRTPDAIVWWHWAIFAASPVFVALSYFGAADVVQRRMFTTSVKARPQAAAEAGAVAGGLTGIPLFVATFAGRIVLFVALIAAVQFVVMRWMMGGITPPANPALGLQVALMGMMIGAITAESLGTRALRTLPLSTPKLALLFLLIPWAGALTSAVFSALWRSGDPALSVWANLAGQALALCGWATFAFAVTMHIASSGRLFVLMLLVMIPGIGVSFFATHTVLFAALGTVAGLAGFALLVRGLRKSSAFYRPRGFFGMIPGQPSAVR